MKIIFLRSEKSIKYTDYTSENTKRLTVSENVKLLKQIVKKNLNKS